MKIIKEAYGMSHDFRLPNADQYHESTIGAHNNFKLNGQ